MEFEIVVILIKVILGILGGTPLMLLIKEVLSIKDFFIKVIVWLICAYITGFLFWAWTAVLAILLLVINLLIGIAYLSVYYPRGKK